MLGKFLKMVHYGINSQQQQQMPSTPNEYQQYNPPLQHFGQQQSPYQQQSLYNQQTPQTYQDHRQHSSLGNSNYNFSVGDPGTPIPRIPSTPHTPQQLPQQHPGSGSGGGRSSFHSHPSTPGSVGLQQGFNSPTAGCIVPTANAYSQQQAQHSETNQFQKQEPQISLFPSLSDYASANIDDINVAASNDGIFNSYETINRKMYMITSHKIAYKTEHKMHLNLFLLHPNLILIFKSIYFS